MLDPVRSSRRAAAILLAAIVVVGACSDDSGGDATATPSVPADAEFTARFSAVCLEMDEKIEGLPDPVGLRSLGDVARQAATITSDGVEQLRMVEAPDELQADVDALVDGLADQVEIFTRLADTAGAGDRPTVDAISTEGDVARRALAAQADALGVDCGLAGEDGVEDQSALPDTGVSTMDPNDAESPTVIPEFGNDPALDALARDCSGGDPQACDILGLSGAPGSGYEEYGSTCGGRNDSLVADPDTFCVDLYPEAVPPSAEGDPDDGRESTAEQ